MIIRLKNVIMINKSAITEADMLAKKFTIPKMACGNCFNVIKNALTKINGVNGITCDLNSRTVSVDFDETLTSDAAVSDKLSKIGFPPEING